MTGGSGDRQNGLAIGQGATGAINDHIEVLAAELLQIIGITPITDHVVHPRWGWLTTPGEQGERVALLLQGGHQRLPHKTGPPHHKDLHQGIGTGAIEAWVGDAGLQDGDLIEALTHGDHPRH